MSRIPFIVLALYSFAAAAYSVETAPRLTTLDVSDSTCMISWQKFYNASSYNVYMKDDSGNGTYIKLNSDPVTKTYVRLLDLVNGMPYYFAVTAIAEDGTETPAATTGMMVPVGYSSKTLSVKGGSRVADYRIFSTPFVSDRQRPEDFFAYFPRYNKDAWRLFSLERDGFREFGDIEKIAPGKAYWFLSRYDTGIFISGKSVNNYKPFYVRLHPGWNIIGSPFLYPVNWDEVLRVNSNRAGSISRAVWEFSGGGFVQTSVLKPFGGYYLFNAYGSDVELLIPPVPAKPKLYDESRASAYAAGDTYAANNTYALDGKYVQNIGWTMRLSVDDGIYHDYDNVIGVDPRASNGHDRMDMLEPPAWPQHLSAYFPQGGNANKKYSTDIRKSGRQWKFIVEGGENPRATIRWDTLSGSRRAELIDTSINKRVEMRKTGSYAFNRSGTGQREFIVRLVRLKKQNTAAETY
ncbi:MAG: hypothetical protein IEMM0002_0888 [bacterium]|nr:MAG: hypothetical protein IEMM0002_0888 [bacterium]